MGYHQTQGLAARERPRADVRCDPFWPRGGSPGPARSFHSCASAPQKLTRHREISEDWLRLELQRETLLKVS